MNDMVVKNLKHFIRSTAPETVEKIMCKNGSKVDLPF